MVCSNRAAKSRDSSGRRRWLLCIRAGMALCEGGRISDERLCECPQHHIDEPIQGNITEYQESRAEKQDRNRSERGERSEKTRKKRYRQTLLIASDEQKKLNNTQTSKPSDEMLSEKTRPFLLLKNATHSPRGLAAHTTPAGRLHKEKVEGRATNCNAAHLIAGFALIGWRPSR